MIIAWAISKKHATQKWQTLSDFYFNVYNFWTNWPGNMCDANFLHDFVLETHFEGFISFWSATRRENPR